VHALRSSLETMSFRDQGVALFELIPKNIDGSNESNVGLDFASPYFEELLYLKQLDTEKALNLKIFRAFDVMMVESAKRQANSVIEILRRFLYN